MIRLWPFPFVMLVLALGCAGQSAPPQATMPAAADKTSTEATPAGAAPSTAAAAAALKDRKIIYDADVRLVVDDFAKVEAAVPRLVQEHGGYLADASVERTQGAVRSGRWQVRIPIDRFDAFLDAVCALGVPESRRQTAQDVTEQFVDLEAQIKTKQQLEQRILELVQERKGKIEEVLEVERELARVRSDIEQMQGRLRYLTNRTEMTTVTVSAREEQHYVPPAAPNLTSRIARTWSRSLVALQNFGETVVHIVVFLAPWAPIVLIVVLPIWYLRRRAARRRSRQ